MTSVSFSSRVNQINAEVLDEEIEDTVYKNIKDIIFDLPSPFWEKIQRLLPEFRLLVKVFLWIDRFSKGSSAAQQLLGISYDGYSGIIISIHFVHSVLLPYLAHRFLWITAGDNVYRIGKKLESVYRLINFIIHLVFLYRGRYRNFFEYGMDLKMLNVSSRMIGTINFESLNRELMWDAFRESFISFITLKGFVIGILPRGFQRYFSNSKGEMQCVKCTRSAVVPVRNAACRHVFCYYCLSTALWCSKCGTATSDKDIHFLHFEHE